MTRTIIVAEELSSLSPLAWERQYELAGIYSRFYRELTEALAPRLANQLDLPLAAAKIFTREMVVPIGYLYLDRLLRLDLFLARDSRVDWAVSRGLPFEYPSRIEYLQQFAGKSKALPQSVLVHQSALWNLEIVDGPRPATVPDHLPRTIANNLFNRSTFSQKVWRVALTAYRFLTGPRKRIPVLSTANSSVAFRNAGFYGTYFTDMLRKIRIEDGSPKPSVRETFRQHLAIAAAAPLGDFLRSAAFPSGNAPANSVLENFVDFGVKAFPSSLLEKAGENLGHGVEALTPHRPGPLIIGELGDLESVVSIAACKVLGMEVVDFQHGGHIGYLLDQTGTLEVEEYVCDRFISWGWDRYPNYPPHPAPPIQALPNPWLSERAKLWRRTLRRLRGREKSYDMLFFSGRVHRFPTLPSGAYQLTTDYLPAYTDFLVDIAREARCQRQRILHKPYNDFIADLMSKALQEMEKEGGEYYKCLDLLDKGLTEELLSQSNVVVWDIPGTGFLECLAGGIPTLCCWPRLYNREEPHAAEAIAALESAGIIHRTPQSLFAESRRIKDIGVEAWMKDPVRVQAVSRFSRAYCWAEDNWAEFWSKFLLHYRR